MDYFLPVYSVYSVRANCVDYLHRGPKSNAPVFTILSFGLLLAVLYLLAGLAQPVIVFFRKHWSRGDVLELFSLIVGALLILMAIFRP